MKVLIAIDEKLAALEAINFVAAHNWETGTEFKLVHTVSPIMVEHPLASYPLFLESAMEESEKAGHTLLTETASELKNRVNAKVSDELMIGCPIPVLIEQAKTWPADLVILGTHARKGLERFFYGSVSYDVASGAPCSVVVLKLPVIAELSNNAKDKNKEPAVEEHKLGRPAFVPGAII